MMMKKAFQQTLLPLVTFINMRETSTHHMHAAIRRHYIDYNGAQSTPGGKQCVKKGKERWNRGWNDGIPELLVVKTTGVLGCTES